MAKTLTSQQVAAATATAHRLYIEAAPGSGKTTVAAARFAVQRFRRLRASDARGVVAVSFTRAATWELRSRIRDDWGRAALRSPHRVVTIDTLVCDLLHHLLRKDQIAWPHGLLELDVRDTWKSLVDTSFTDRAFDLVLDGPQVKIVTRRDPSRAQRPQIGQVVNQLNLGVCTHDEVRQLVASALDIPDMRASLIARLRETARAVIIDEVFDANELDLAVLELAAEADVDFTLIGDPWQALYRFRGARPDLVPELVATYDVARLDLSESFRWRSDEQRRLAEQLRHGRAITLQRADAPDGLDVVLACEWKHLWDAGGAVLPLAFGAAKGNIPEAGATLLLDYVTRSALGLRATYIDDALSTLRIADETAVDRFDAAWPTVLERLRGQGRQALEAAYSGIAEVVRDDTTETFPAVRGNYTKRLGWLRSRLTGGTPLIPGMTIHQAKGREWERVGLALQDHHRTLLTRGLSSSESLHRQLYVGCTRASHETVDL